MEEKRSIDPITDPKADLNLRIQSLELLIERVARIVPFLVELLETELRREDTRFVIYIFGAMREVYDRRLIPPLAKLLRAREVELTFRMQCVDVLRELYRNSVAGLDVAAEAIKAGRLDDPAVLQFLTTPQQLDVVFTVKGEDLNDEDRREIEIALRDIAENPEEVQPLRDEAQAALELIWDLKYPKRGFITSPLSRQPE